MGLRKLQFCRMLREMWIMSLHGMVVTRKRVSKTKTYRVWRRIKALKIEFLPATSG
jgi:hypothetical protein